MQDSVYSVLIPCEFFRMRKMNLLFNFACSLRLKEDPDQRGRFRGSNTTGNPSVTLTSSSSTSTNNLVSIYDKMCLVALWIENYD